MTDARPGMLASLAIHALLFAAAGMFARAVPLGVSGVRVSPRWVVGELEKVRETDGRRQAPATGQAADAGEKSAPTSDVRAAASASGPSSASPIAIRPQYPRRSRLLGEEGEVWIRIDVSAGAVSASILRSSGYRRLDEAALAAAREASLQGLSGARELKIVFRLSDPG
ncbi:MAG TPA: TonB family protein [Bdellovibrionota bacterium]|nr:TonB family protein [Bdellovibrionota bacterium]